ncbi:glycosyltransferase family 2 protein [Flavobacterium sp.]|uniref:glycosyltransferase family 2 protein n=1 Tax=Flavobacterium sp. TaxID=239 RepID=UPI00286CF143|nr:glycosyltransferase family 2 protein [Flavobacterium sp.]
MVYFSIIIPLFNKQDHIENTMKSVLNQTYKNYEIIVINDGSTDESVSKVLEFKDSRIQLYNQENQGVSVARNLGIEKAKYNYIAFLDADDLWMENHLETLENLIKDFPNAGIFASRYQLVFKEGKVTIPKFKGIATDFYGIVHDYFDASLNYAVTTSSSVVVPKWVFEGIGIFKPNITSGEDIDMWIRIATKHTVAISNKITASYIHYIQNSLSKISILEHEIKNFNDYKLEELSNPSLKKYLDLYRIEYALQYKIAGEKSISMQLYRDIDKKNIKLKSKIVFQLPRKILLILLQLKQYLRSKGIDFSIYQ